MRPFGLNHRFPCRRTQLGAKRAATQDKPIEASSSTARGPAPPQGRGRTSAPKHHPWQLALSKRLSKLDRTRPPKIPPDNGFVEQESPRSTERARRLPTTDAPNRNHASRKVGKASLPACLNLANTSVKPSFYGASMRCLAARRKQNEPPKLLPRQRVRRAGESPSDRTNLATPDNRCAQSQSRVQQSQQGSCYQLSSISRMRW